MLRLSRPFFAPLLESTFPQSENSSMSLKIYDYCCRNHHVFEAWLKTDDDRPEACPVCGSPEIERRLSAPAIRPAAGTTRTDIALDQEARARKEAAQAAESFHDALMCELRQIASQARDVGEAFPETVRRMHEGKEERELVRGKCSPREAIELTAEGIELMPLPDEATEPLN